MTLFLLTSSPPSLSVLQSRFGKTNSFPSSQRFQSRRQLTVKACIFEDPLLKEAIKEPVAFFGGLFAGLLRLDLNEDPLKEWITRTVEASGFAEQGIGGQGSTSQQQDDDEESPQQIVIE